MNSLDLTNTGSGDLALLAFLNLDWLLVEPVIFAALWFGSVFAPLLF